MKKLILALATITFFLASCSEEDNLTTTPVIQLQDGDIIFQTSKSAQSKAIQLETGSKYSHVGIIYLKHNKTFVYEAVQPVNLTPPKDWIKRGEGSHYVVKRLKNADAILTPEIRSKMGSFGESFKGKPYDIYFEWSDDRIYCSDVPCVLGYRLFCIIKIMTDTFYLLKEISKH